MPSQIFKLPFPKEKLYEFLDKCAEKNTDSYKFSKTSYKTAQYKEIIQPFCDTIKDYYFDSKKYYATRQITYKNIITIIRQLCKYHFIPFNSNIKYSQSIYEISYTIFISPEQ